MPRHDGRPEVRKARESGIALAGACVAGPLLLGAVGTALAQQATTLNGPPVQVIPYVSEPGVPAVNVNPATPNPFPEDDGSTDGSDPGGGSGGSIGDSTALSTMMNTTWGTQAVSVAQTMGVNPSALAATCVIESSCQNVTGSGTVAGAFQMTASTYNAMLAQAVAANPSLASQAVYGQAGQMNPVSEAIAASQYLSNAAQMLQNTGVSNPTVLDTRGYYNFGPSGTAIATASDNALMSQVMPNVSQATFAANGVTATTTVGQWKANVAAKIGNAAGQSVLN